MCSDSLRQYRIILSADTASEVPQLPERCLSRKAGIVRCCLKCNPKIKTEYTNKKSARFPASYRENRQILLFYGIIASI